MATQKLSESSSVPSDETEQSIDPSLTILLFCRHLSCSIYLIRITHHIIPISLNNRKVPVLLTSRVIGQGSPTTSPLQRVHSLCKFVSVRYVNSRKNSFHQLTHRVHRGIERRQGDISALLYNQDRQNSLGTRPVYTSPLNDMFTTLPRESKRALSKIRNFSLHK